MGEDTYQNVAILCKSDINVQSQGPGGNLPAPANAAISGAKAAIQRRGPLAAGLALNLHLGCPPTPMLSKVCASWLVVLVLLPFTAPFSTVRSHRFAVRGERGLDGGTIDDDADGGPDSCRAVAAVPFPLRAVGHRPALTRLRASSVVTIAPVPGRAAFRRPGDHIVHPLSCPTVLRI